MKEREPAAPCQRVHRFCPLRDQDFEKRREPVMLLSERAVVVVHQGIDGDLGKGGGGGGRHGRKKTEAVGVSFSGDRRRLAARYRPCGRGVWW